MSALRRKYNITAMIPAKLGSTRLPMKNLALLGDKPLIYYAINAAKKSNAFDQIVVNAEDAIFSEIAHKYKVGFYKRPDRLVSPTTKSDVVVYDFLKSNPCDIVAWINPIAPLQTGKEVRDIVTHFVREGLDSLITVKNEQVHCLYKGKPVNFRMDEVFAQTQDLLPVQSFVYSVMMWRSKIFIRAFEKKGYTFLCGKVGFYPVSALSSIIIKRKEDLAVAENVFNATRRGKNYKIKYDKMVRHLLKGAR